MNPQIGGPPDTGGIPRMAQIEDKSGAYLYSDFDSLKRDFDLWLEIKFGDLPLRAAAMEKFGLRRLLSNFLGDERWHEARRAAGESERAS